MLLSKYQICENGYVLDLVAIKHMKAPGVSGTQRLVLNEDIHIPFVDRGGKRGFEILPIEIEEEKFDTYELTCAKTQKSKQLHAGIKIQDESHPG